MDPDKADGDHQAYGVTISCLIMECLQEKSGGYLAAGPDGKAASHTFSSGFVDDVTLWIGDMLRAFEGQEDPSTMLDETQMAAQWWESLLTATGGKLEFSKCFFYLMFWVFNEDGEPRLLEPEELPYPIEIVDSVTKDTIRIETRSCTKAHKTLGVMETPNGNYKPETDRLMTKANEFARKATLVSVSEQDTTTLYFSMIHSSMRYSAPAGKDQQQNHRISTTFHGLQQKHSTGDSVRTKEHRRNRVEGLVCRTRSSQSSNIDKAHTVIK
jgi:hypothetical protein